MKKVFIILSLVFAASAALRAQEVPVDPQVKIGKLENGLTYYIRHNAEPAGQANFYIAQKVGSILEDENQRGLAHFLEHMCFNGTKNFPGNNIIKYCESIGVKFGNDLNAYTSIDETVYNIDNVPVATTPSAVDSCLWILHDWAGDLLLTDEDIDNERGVIHEEWRTRSDASMRLYEQILPVILPGNRYGQRLPIGLMEVVDNFPYQVLRDYYHKWYRPDQQGIIVVGDIDVNELEAKIKDIFGTLPARENPAERFYVQIEDNEEPIICLAKDKEQAYAIATIMKKHEAVPNEEKSSLQYYLYYYMQNLISLMVNQRLEEMLQVPEPPFVDAVISDEDFFTIAKTKKAYTGQVVLGDDFLGGLTALYREMLRAAKCGFTESEYERAREELIATVETQYNQREKRKSASFCSEYVRHFIDNEPIPGIENEYALIQQLAPAIPVEAVNQVAASLLEENNLVVAFMLPDVDGVEYPDAEAIKAALKAVEEEDITPYEDKVSDEPLLSTLPKAGKIKKTEKAHLGYTKLTLSNGATVYYKITDFNQDQILMSASSFGGLSLYPASDAVNLKCADEVFSLGGLGNFSQTDLTKALSGKKVSVNSSISLFTESVSGRTTPKDMETFFQLMYLTFTDVRKDDEAFASWKNKSRALLQNAEVQPMNALRDSLYDQIYVDSRLMGNIKSSQIDEVDYDHILAIGKERFANAADFKFVFTGAIDEELFLAYVKQYIASLPGKGKAEVYDKKAVSYATGKNDCTFDRPMQVPMATVAFIADSPVTYSYKDEIAYDIACQTLSTVLLAEIREKEGGTYSINATGSFSSIPREEALLQIVYQTNPDRYEYLNGRIFEIIDKFLAEGPEESEVAKIKEYLLKNYQESVMENSGWQSAMLNYLISGVDTITDYDKTVSSLTVNDVRSAFEKVYKDSNTSLVIMNGVQE